MGDPEERARSARGCAFCRIVRSEAPARVVAEDEATLAFLDHRPRLPRHCLLVPRLPHTTLADLPGEQVAPLFAAARRLAAAVEAGMGADGSFVAINNRVSQSVPHLHVHVVPRWTKDGLFGRNVVWARRRYEDEAAADRAAAATRAALARHPPIRVPAGSAAGSRPAPARRWAGGPTPARGGVAGRRRQQEQTRGRPHRPAPSRCPPSGGRRDRSLRDP